MANQDEQTVLCSILLFKEYQDKDDVLYVANKMLQIVEGTKSYSARVKNAYKNAADQLKSLSFKDMKDIIDILSDDDE